MDQLDPKNQKNKPMFNVIEPSIVRAHFAANRDVSFSSFLQPHNHHKQDPRIRAEDSDQISIFDAAKYFSGLHDDQKDQHCTKNVDMSPIPPRLSSVSSSIDEQSNYGGRNSSGTYRARSFHATPTASSEASWNSQTGLLANPPGSVGISVIKNMSPNSSGSRGTNSSTTPRWPKISSKWLIPRRKCPCSGKKSVQVEEKIEAKTPRMVDLRRSTSSNGSMTNASSLYSPRQSSPLTNTLQLPPSPNLHQEPRNINLNLMAKNPTGSIGYSCNSNSNNHSSRGFSSSPKIVGPLKVYDDLAKVHGTNTSTTTTTTTTSATSIGFSFPVLENPPVGVKKMFNVVAPGHNHDEPHRDSLEVFQPKSHPSPKSRRASYEEENASDASSDLFEIESFSTTYPCRESMDEVIIPSSNLASMKRLGLVVPGYNQCRNNMGENEYIDEPVTPSVAQTECYAPSEVSIDWSVTTAEGFDRASLTNFSVSASEFGYVAMRREAEKNGGGNGEGKGSKGSGHNRNGNGTKGLLSCRCEKAVSVGPGPIKCSVEAGPPMPARHVSGRPQQQPQAVAAHASGNGNGKPSLVVGKSRSTLLSMPYAT